MHKGLKRIITTDVYSYENGIFNFITTPIRVKIMLSVIHYFKIEAYTTYIF
jgi:hypothetical protein